MLPVLRVLIVEDKPADAELMVLRLTREGYKLDWKRVQTEVDFLESLATPWDLILADWSLPQFSGLRALQILRESGLEIPFIIVSGSIGEEAAIDALHKGANDYLLKDRPERLGQAIRQALEQKVLREEKKKKDQQLQMQSLALNAAANAIMITDLNGSIEWANPAFSALSGYSLDEIIGKNPRDLVKSGKQDHAFYKKMWDCILTGRVWHGELVNRHKDGQLYYEDLTITPLLDAAGGVNKFIAIKQDITERKKDEEQIKYQASLLENVNDAITATDLNHKITAWNRAAELLFGWKAEEAIGRITTDLFKTEYPNTNRKEVLAIRDRTGRWRGETSRVRKDGVRISLEESSIALKDENGKITGYVGAGRDITERKQAEKVREAIYEISQSAIETMEMGKFYSSIHHILGRLIPLENFYIFLYDQESDRISFTYYVDQFDPPESPRKPGRGLSEYVLRTGKPLLVSPETFDDLMKQGKIELVGTKPVDWLGVPLKVGGKVFGVMVTQSYTKDIRFSEDDLNLFETVSTVVALTIQRKQSEEELHKREELYRSLFEKMMNGFAYCQMQYDHLGKPIDFKYLVVNKAFETQTGLKDVVGKMVSEVIPGIQKNDPGIIETYGRVASTGKPKSFEVFIESMQMWFNVSVYSPQRGYFVSVFDVITDRKKAEAEISLRVNQLATAREIGKTLSETLELDQIYERLYQAVTKLLPNSETMFVSLFNNEKKEFRCVFAISESERLDISQLPPAPLEPPGIGTQSEVVRTRNPLIVGNLQERLKKVSLVVDIGKGSQEPQSGLYVPMLTKGKAIGVVIVQSQKLNRYTADDAEMLSLVANTAASAIQNAQLFAQTERRLQQISAMHTIDSTISSSFDLELTFTIMLEILTSQLGVDAADILVLNKNTQILECRGRRGFRTQALQYTKLPLGQGLAGQAAVERKMLVIKDLPGEMKKSINSPELATEGFVTYIGVPLTAKGEIIGVLEIFHREKLEPTNEWFDYLENMAGQAAIAIDNSMLFNYLQRSNMDLSMAYDATILGWSNALDLRDKETEGHSQRVMEMTMQLAIRMELGEQELIHVRRGALLHDIGKMGVADSILLKPGALDEEEWVSMRRHPLLAYNLLNPIPYLQKALEIPYCHHEKWDGSGYPRGLKGEQIPLPARIFAIVDVWDALISDRPYRKAWTKPKALEYIKEQSGKHFDPQVVKEFLQLDGIRKQKGL